MAKRKFVEIYEVDYSEENASCQSDLCGNAHVYEFRAEGVEKPILGCSGHLNRQTVLAQSKARDARDRRDAMRL